MPLSTPFLGRSFGSMWATVTGAEYSYYDRLLLLFVSLIDVLVSGGVITVIRSSSLQMFIIASTVSTKGLKDSTRMPLTLSEFGIAICSVLALLISRLRVYGCA
jgi:hypothetical protein